MELITNVEDHLFTFLYLTTQTVNDLVVVFAVQKKKKTPYIFLLFLSAGIQSILSQSSLD